MAGEKDEGDAMSSSGEGISRIKHTLKGTRSACSRCCSALVPQVHDVYFEIIITESSEVRFSTCD